MKTPVQQWKSNKWRIDLRDYTRKFQDRFYLQEKLQIFPGEVYAANYRVSQEIPTDKHHFTPLFLSFGRFKDEEGKNYARGLNLFYLRNEQKLELLEESHREIEKTPQARVQPIIKIHEKWIKIAPYAFKNFEESRIIAISKISPKEWGMIPLLRDYLYGTFNSAALNKDFVSENSRTVLHHQKKKESIKTITEKDTEEVILEDTEIPFQFIEDI